MGGRGGACETGYVDDDRGCMTMIEVLEAGLETAVQDYPGRIGMLRHGIPPSGPLDDWSFRLANKIVGNPEGAAGLECQFLGPTLRFHSEALISLCGADMSSASRR